MDKDYSQYSHIMEYDDGWFIAWCPEVPGANGQGRTKDECLKSLHEAIALIMEVRHESPYTR